MSIQQVQTKNLLELIARSFFVNGKNPLSTQLYSNLSAFFAAHPAGQPISLDADIFRTNGVADEEAYNDFMALMVVNIDTLYEVCANQVDEILMTNTILRTHLDRLKITRRVLEHKIDDYLLGLYNSDGYFYSFSDSFSDTSTVDFAYTSAFIDTIATTASIPAVGSLSANISMDKIGSPTVSVIDADSKSLGITKKTDFNNAVDGMTNTAWYFEVRTSSPISVTATITIPLSLAEGDNVVTRIDLTPYGITPVQCGINGRFRSSNSTNIATTTPFSNQVKTSADKMTFIGDQINDPLDSIIIQLSKTEADYVENNSSRQYVYIFGMKELLMTEQVYDSFATMVSKPFGIPDQLKDEAVIDAVSLVAEDHTPTNTSLTYYIAADNTNATSISDFDWREITPISNNMNTSSSVVNFSGSLTATQTLRRSPRTSSDLKMFDLNTTSPDLSKRNPTPSYIPGVDVYRIATFADTFLTNSLKLEEGINTTRIFYTELDDDAITKDFTWWKAKFDDPTSYFTSYGEIDSGHEFFYGSDVGEDGKSVYAETFLETTKEYPVFLKECRKSDINSRQWNVRIFLNGREIANMPVGVDKLTIPWKLKEGTNHIVLMANIPDSSVAVPSPYIGTFNIMADANLTDFGIVKLDNWTYVDLYKFQNNQVNEPNSFTIYNNELISRKKPTNNFRLSFKKDTQVSPENIRLRVDMTRSTTYAHSTPLLDSYRIRFAYS